MKLKMHSCRTNKRKSTSFPLNGLHLINKYLSECWEARMIASILCSYFFNTLKIHVINSWKGRGVRRVECWRRILCKWRRRSVLESTGSSSWWVNEASITLESNLPLRPAQHPSILPSIWTSRRQCKCLLTLRDALMVIIRSMKSNLLSKLKFPALRSIDRNWSNNVFAGKANLLNFNKYLNELLWHK